MHHTDHSHRLLRYSLFLSCLLTASLLQSAEVFHVAKGDSWKYHKGTEAPSSPAGSWHTPGFDDAAWAEGRAPFGFDNNEDYNFGTELLDMQGTYTTLFLRRRFDLPSAGSVSELEVRIFYDDGFVIWINGTELLRENVPDGEITHDPGSTPDAIEPMDATLSLPDPSEYLVDGTNTICVAMVNRSISSSDLMFDLALVDPVGIDTFPPDVAQASPAEGATIRTFDTITITFDETVTGVDAADLLVNGAPAPDVSGSGSGPYAFQCGAVTPGTIEVQWSADHGITDTSDLHNAFEGGSWSFTLDPSAPPGDLVINEFLASNRGNLLDEDGESSDWIEIYNRGAEPVNLNGWALTDDPEREAKWLFPAVTLESQEMIVVFASGKNRSEADGELHTNFQLDAQGEYLGLYTPDSPPVLVDGFSPVFPEQRADVSYGVCGGEKAYCYFEIPTPEDDNNIASSLDGFVDDTEFSIDRGFYDTPFEVAITCATEGAQIRYTTDGSEPGSSSGTLYSTPVSINGTTVLRAIAYKSNYIPSNVDTQTYIFIDDILTQPMYAPGFPTSWSGAPSVDYGMDSQVVNDSAYSDILVEGLVAIPTVSLVLDREDLFGPSGLYSNPTREGVGYERPASVELIFPDGDREGFQENCGARIQGGASRVPNKSPKHSFRLLFKDEYGPTRLRYPLFPESPVITFDTITFRAGFNNSWVHWDSNQRGRAQYIRDQWARDTQLAMGRVGSHGTFVHLYLNGLYWGLYNLVERPSAPFAADYFGGEKEEYDALNSGDPIDGNTSAWNYLNSLATSRNLSIQSNYEAVADYLDIPALIDYMIINIYGCNSDWPHHNWYAARKREAGAQYRFFSWDAERILEDKNCNNSSVSNTNSPAVFYDRLRANEEFRLLFADHLQKHFFNGGVMTPAAITERWMARAREIEKAVVCESARWGDYRRDVHNYSNGPYEFYRLNSHWLPEQNRLVDDYFPDRSQIVFNQFKSRGLYPSLNAPVFNQHGGEIEKGFSLRITNPNGAASGTIYYTRDGTDPRTYGTGEPAPTALIYTEPDILTEPAMIKARILDGGTWSAVTEAMFHIPQPIEALKITEIMYDPPAFEELNGEAFEFLELKNTGTETLDLSAVSITDGVWFRFPEGTILGNGDFIVLASNPDAFPEKYPDYQGDLFSYWRNLANNGDTITLNDAEGEPFLSISYYDLEPWPAEAAGGGYSMVPVDPAAPGDPNTPAFWRASTLEGGSPGEDDPGEVPSGGLQLPGDYNQDTVLDLSDAISLLLYLFGGKTDTLPCDGATANDGGNLPLLDVNNNQIITISDVVFILRYLFADGEPPALGTRCVRIEGCPHACAR